MFARRENPQTMNDREEEKDQNEEKPKRSFIGKLLKVVLPLALGIAIIYYLLSEVPLDEVWAIIKDANWGILAFSLLFGLLGNTIRGYRWQLLINPLGYYPKVRNLNFAIYGGYAINFALPRAGEVWRCGIIAKEEKIPFTKLFGTVIMDRLMDTTMVLGINLFAFLFNMRFFIEQFKQNEATLDSAMKYVQSPLLYVAAFVCIVAIFIVFKYFKHVKLVRKIIDIVKGMWEDMKAIWRMKQKIRLIFYSFGIWGSYFLYFYITFFAFGFTENLGVTAGLIAFALSSLSMGIPTNGGLGPWQVAVIAALSLYQVDQVSAVAFATGVFFLQSFWVIICGLFGIGALALKKK